MTFSSHFATPMDTIRRTTMYAETPITNAKMYAEVLTLLQLPAAYAPIRPNKFSIMAVCSAKMAGFALQTRLIRSKTIITRDAMKEVALQ